MGVAQLRYRNSSAPQELRKSLSRSRRALSEEEIPSSAWPPEVVSQNVFRGCTLAALSDHNLCLVVGDVLWWVLTKFDTTVGRYSVDQVNTYGDGMGDAAWPENVAQKKKR